MPILRPILTNVHVLIFTGLLGIGPLFCSTMKILNVPFLLIDVPLGWPLIWINSLQAVTDRHHPRQLSHRLLLVNKGISQDTNLQVSVDLLRVKRQHLKDQQKKALAPTLCSRPMGPLRSYQQKIQLFLRQWGRLPGTVRIQVLLWTYSVILRSQGHQRARAGDSSNK